MQTAEIIERVIRVIKHTLPRVAKTDLQPFSSLREDMDLNSLETVELVLALEKEFDIKIPNDAVINLRSARNIVNVVAQSATAGI